MYIIDFLKVYSQDVLTVAFIVAISSAIIDKFLTQNQKLYIKMFTPFILGIMIFFLINVFKGNVSFNHDTVYAGILSGSLSLTIFAFFDRLLKGKNEKTDVKILAIEKLLNGFVKPELIEETAKEIKEEIDKKNERKVSLNVICSLIKKNKTNVPSEQQITVLANICLDTVKNLCL